MQPESQKLVSDLHLHCDRLISTDGTNATHLRDTLVRAANHITLLEQQLTEARKDTEMLDWLEVHGWFRRSGQEIYPNLSIIYDGDASTGFRQAITLAMKKGQSE